MSDKLSSPTPSNHPGETTWNFFTGLLVVGVIAALVIVALIYLNPRSTLNPLPHPTPISTLALVTQTIRQSTISPSMTPSVSQLTITYTPTQPISPTPTAILATPAGTLTGASLTPTAKSNSNFAFITQTDPKGIDAGLFSPKRACQWMGVAGQAFDIKNNPVPLGIEVQLAGILDNKPLLITSLTGTATLYGSSGYEITLAEKPIASRNSLWIRLLDQSGLALSDRVYFDTYADCSKNLIIINFKQVK